MAGEFQDKEETLNGNSKEVKGYEETRHGASEFPTQYNVRFLQN